MDINKGSEENEKWRMQTLQRRMKSLEKKKHEEEKKDQWEREKIRKKRKKIIEEKERKNQIKFMIFKSARPLKRLLKETCW